MCQGFRLNKARCLFLKQAVFFEAAVLDLIIGSGLKPNHHNQVKLVNIPDTHHTNRLSSSKMWKTQTTGCGNSVLASVLGCFLRFRPFSSKLSLNTLTMRIFLVICGLKNRAPWSENGVIFLNLLHIHLY